MSLKTQSIRMRLTLRCSNVFSGAIWQPFLNLSASLVQHRYGVSEGLAATQASVLGVGAIILYPIVRRVILQCLSLSN